MAEEEDGKPSFWKTAPGFMTGVAALLTAIVTVLAFLGLGHSSGQQAASSGQQAAPTTTQAAPTATARAAATAASPAQPAAAGQPLWQGDLLLNGDADFDTVPPDRNAAAPAIDVSIDDMHQGPHLLEAFNGGFRWDQAGNPTEQQCADKLAGFSTSQVLLDVGTRTCVGTNGGRVVLIQVIKVNSDSYNVHVTVWAAP